MPDKAQPDPCGSLQRFKVLKEKIILGVKLSSVGSSLAQLKGFSTDTFGGAVDQQPSASCGHQGARRCQLSVTTCPDPKGKCKPCKGKHLPCPTSICLIPQLTFPSYTSSTGFENDAPSPFPKNRQDTEKCCNSQHLAQPQAQE